MCSESYTRVQVFEKTLITSDHLKGLNFTAVTRAGPITYYRSKKQFRKINILLIIEKTKHFKLKYKISKVQNKRERGKNKLCKNRKKKNVAMLPHSNNYQVVIASKNHIQKNLINITIP